jgi:hypothetical protein
VSHKEYIFSMCRNWWNARLARTTQGRRSLIRSLLLAALAVSGPALSQPSQIDLQGPPGSVAFGAQIAVLPNGNIVVTDPRRPPSGAAYLYSANRELISTVENIYPGAHSLGPLDSVKIIVLANGNYLLHNFRWRNGAVFDAGMVAWGSGELGLSGSISAANALVGTDESDFLGFFGIRLLANGNYVVRSSATVNSVKLRGLTWGSGVSGVSGVATADNSLLGEALDATPLSNGNYVVVGPGWDGYTGAAMWVDGAVGATGYMTAGNSLAGSVHGDFLEAKVYPLTNGNYVLSLPFWDNGAEVDAGAVVWGSGTQPKTGVISSSNALVGARTKNFVGYDEVQALTNGNYVVASSDWEGETGINVGAVTWANGETGRTGEVSAANSLIGSADFDFIGGHPVFVVDGVVALANGNYVVTSARWDAERGAITWGDGVQGTSGVVSPQNSLVGTSVGDRLGLSSLTGVTPLTNGNYVVASPSWKDPDGTAFGAATWLDGNGPHAGPVNVGNSLTGTSPDDTGISAVALANGNYVVTFSGWDRPQIPNAGAVVWGNGSVGRVGRLSVETALVGSNENQFLGGAIPLTDGNYIVCNENFSTASASRLGAVIWGSGWGELVGEMNATNSLIGSTMDDRLCSNQIDYLTPRLPDGRYLVASLRYDDGVVDAGAFTLGDGRLTGFVNHENSVIGTVREGGENGGRPGLFAAYDFANDRLAVGRPASNLVTFMTGPRLFRSGFAEAPFH